MKNKNLINLLMQENPDAEVIVAYDSMCGQYDNFIMARNRRNGDIYLACEDAESIDLASNDWLELIPLELCCTDSLIDENKRLRAENERLRAEVDHERKSHAAYARLCEETENRLEAAIERLTSERDEARAERDAARRIVLDAAHEDAEWQDKEVWPLDGDIYQNWRIVLYLPVPVTQADKEIGSALDRAIAAAIEKNAG